MKKAVIENGVCTNIIKVPDDEFTLEGAELVTANGANIGWNWDGSTFTEPELENE